jgi:hypothetical protein
MVCLKVWFRTGPKLNYKKGKKVEEIVPIQFWSGGAARTHCAGAEYEARIPIVAITLNFVNLYNTTGYAYKEEDWNV